MQFGPTGDQLSQVQHQVALLEHHLATQSHEAETHIHKQRAEYSGRARDILLEQRTEFETRASSYEIMAREVAMTELQQQRETLGADHSAQLDRISLFVRHSEP